MKFLNYILLILGLIFFIKIIADNLTDIFNFKKKEVTDTKGWKVMPYGGRRVREFKDRKELEKYRLYTLIINVLNTKNELVLKGSDYSHFYIIYDDLRLEVKLEALNDRTNRNILSNNYNSNGLKLKLWRKEERIYRLLKKELLNYTYMIDGKKLKLGENTLIARVAHCDIKVDIRMVS